LRAFAAANESITSDETVTVDRQRTCTKYAISSEHEGRRTSNLVNGWSLDLQSFYLEQPSATNQNTQQHEASHGLSAIAELLVSKYGQQYTYTSDPWMDFLRAIAEKT